MWIGVGYSRYEQYPPAQGSIKLNCPTQLASIIEPAVKEKFREIVAWCVPIRNLAIVFCDTRDEGCEGYDLFTDWESASELALKEYGIIYHRIRIATPRHNGKVERQHRIDQERFYSKLRMYSLEDGRKQLAAYQRKSNDYIKLCLGLHSPNEVLADYLSVM